MTYRGQIYSVALIPANVITFAHFSISSATNLPNSADVPTIGSTPNVMRRALRTGSTTPPLISDINLNFNFSRDIAPVASIGGTPFVMAFNPSFPAKTIPELIAYAKANPGKVNMASQGIGTTPHVCGELFKMMTGVDFIHVPYRTNLMPDLLAGQVDFYFSPMPQAIEYVRDGRLHALGVTTAARAEALPNVPAIGEFLPGYVAVGWFGICVPMGTPTVVVEKLNAEISGGVVD